MKQARRRAPTAEKKIALGAGGWSRAGCEIHRRAMKRQEGEGGRRSYASSSPCAAMHRRGREVGKQGVAWQMRYRLGGAAEGTGWAGSESPSEGVVPVVAVSLSSDHGGDMEPAEKHRGRVASRLTLCRESCTSVEGFCKSGRPRRHPLAVSLPCHPVPRVEPHSTRILAAGIPLPIYPRHCLVPGGSAGPVRTDMHGVRQSTHLLSFPSRGAPSLQHHIISTQSMRKGN